MLDRRTGAENSIPAASTKNLATSDCTALLVALFSTGFGPSDGRTRLPPVVPHRAASPSRRDSHQPPSAGSRRQAPARRPPPYVSRGMISAARRSICCVSSNIGLSRIICAPASATSRSAAAQSSDGPKTATDSMFRRPKSP